MRHRLAFYDTAPFGTRARRRSDRAQQPEVRDRALRVLLHEALKTGPLKSEAQGLDLSVDIAGDDTRHSPQRR
jgi:hypothetical protein